MKRNASPFIKDVAVTFATTVVVAGASVIATPLLAHGMGAMEFGVLSLARRVVFWATAISSLDMAVALTRHLGVSRGDGFRTREYLVAAVAIVVACTTIIVVLGLIFSEPLGRALFGRSNNGALIRASLFMMASHGCYHITYAYFRGVGQMWRANLLQLALLGVGALCIAWFYASHGAVFVVTATGMLYLSAGVLVGRRVFGIHEGNLSYSGVRSATLELVKYGSPRVFAGFSYQGLLAIGPLIAATSSMADVAYMTLAQMSFMVLETIFGSFGLVALPRVAQMAGAKESIQPLEAGVADGIMFIAQVGLFGTVHALIWSDVVVRAWLGIEYQPVVLLLRILLLALIPYVAYTLLKSIIDGVEPRAVNAKNLVVSLVVGLVVGFGLTQAGFGRTSAAVGVTAAFVTLGALTVRFLIARYDVTVDQPLMFTTAAVNVFIGALSAAAHAWAVRAVGSSVGQLAIGVGVTGLAAIGYLIWLRSARVDWLERFWSGLSAASDPDVHA